MTLKRFIPVDCGRNDVVHSGECSPPVKKIMRGALNTPTCFPPHSSYHCFLVFLFQSI